MIPKNMNFDTIFENISFAIVPEVKHAINNTKEANNILFASLNKIGKKWTYPDDILSCVSKSKKMFNGAIEATIVYNAAKYLELAAIGIFETDLNPSFIKTGIDTNPVVNINNAIELISYLDNARDDYDSWLNHDGFNEMVNILYAYNDAKQGDLEVSAKHMKLVSDKGSYRYLNTTPLKDYVRSLIDYYAEALTSKNSDGFNLDPSVMQLNQLGARIDAQDVFKRYGLSF